MPDDNKVAEQQEVKVDEEDGGKAATPDEEGFSGAFSEALGGEEKKPSSDEGKTEEEKAAAEETKEADEKKAVEEKTVKAEEEKKKTDEDKAKAEKEAADKKAGKGEKSEAEKKAEADKAAAEKAGETKTGEELAEERGRELLKAEEKAKKEDDEKVEQKKKDKEATDAATKAAEPAPITKEQISTFTSIIPEADLPDEIEIGDQTYNIKEYLSDYPEAQIISGLMTQKILERLVNNGVLMTADQHNKKFDDIEDRIFGMYFDFTVLRDVPDAFDVVETKEYKDWLEKTATKEDKALLNSTKPEDYVLGLKKFQNRAPATPAEAAKKKASEDAAAKKKAHNELHSSTLKAGATKKDLSLAMETGSDDEFSSGFKEAADKAEKEDK